MEWLWYVLASLGAGIGIFFSNHMLLSQLSKCFATLAAFVIPCVLVLLPVRFLTKVPSFVFRKLLHSVAFLGFAVMILSTSDWIAAALTCLLFIVLLYPLLLMLEKKEWFGRLFVQKTKGEVKRSMIMLLGMFASLIGVIWGFFGLPAIAVAAIFMWGAGDAAAALVGIPFGKHNVKCRLTDGKKSYEGSAAMLSVSFVGGFLVLLLAQGLHLDGALLLALVGALVGTMTELFSPSEIDTVTVPIAIASVLLLLLPFAV